LERIEAMLASLEKCEKVNLFFFCFITLKPRVEGYTKSMSLKYEPVSEPLHMSVK